MMKPVRNRGGILSGLLFTFVALIALAVIGGFYVVRNVRVETTHRRGGDDVSIDTPGGRFQIRAHEDIDPLAAGVPIYPGATRTKDSGVATFRVGFSGRQGRKRNVRRGRYALHHRLPGPG